MYVMISFLFFCVNPISKWLDRRIVKDHAINLFTNESFTGQGKQTPAYVFLRHLVRSVPIRVGCLRIPETKSSDCDCSHTGYQITPARTVLV